MILILKRASSTVRGHKTLAQEKATTWWQESKERERERESAATTWWQEFRERKRERERERERESAATTWWQEPQNKLVIATIWLEFTKKSHTAPLVHLQVSRRNTALPVNRNSAVKTHLRRSKQTKFCWPFSSWQTITILRTFTITSTEFPNCQSH